MIKPGEGEVIQATRPPSNFVIPGGCLKILFCNFNRFFYFVILNIVMVAGLSCLSAKLPLPNFAETQHGIDFELGIYKEKAEEYYARVVQGFTPMEDPIVFWKAQVKDNIFHSK